MPQKINSTLNPVNVISINETKLNKSIRDHEVHIPGYEVIRRDRLNKCGGGICFYVKNSINFTVRNDLHMDAIENLCLEVHKPNSKGTLKISSTFHYPALIITKTALATMAPHYGTVYHAI